jgi:hypothetical protein
VAARVAEIDGSQEFALRIAGCGWLRPEAGVQDGKMVGQATFQGRLPQAP